MNTKLIFVFLFTIGLIVPACNPVQLPDAASTLAPGELCNQVNSLIDQHQQGFEQLKRNLVTSSRMDIWQAKYHLVGNDCEIWRWSNGKQAYMCSQLVPDELIAIEKYNNAVNFSRQCLGESWKIDNIDRPHGRSHRAIFSKSGFKTVASIHRVKTEGLFKSEWTIYYFIGDRDRSL